MFRTGTGQQLMFKDTVCEYILLAISRGKIYENKTVLVEFLWNSRSSTSWCRQHCSGHLAVWPVSAPTVSFCDCLQHL